MNPIARVILTLVGVWLSLTGRQLIASPVTGQFTNHNSQFGGSQYDFAAHAAHILVLHHFEVEVC